MFAIESNRIFRKYKTRYKEVDKMEFLKKIFLPFTATLDFIQKYFKSLVFIFVVLLIVGSGNTDTSKEANLIQIDIHGPIMSADDVLKKIDEAKKDNIKGVLVDIDSPGGAVPPSIEIAMSIQELKKKKPVVVYASGTIASGGYYSAIWADKIVVNPGSLVGSIGVILNGMKFDKLMEKIGVETQFAKSGKYKEVGTPTREWTADERAEVQKVIDDTYDMFVNDVTKARNLDIKDKLKYADAHIFTARQAKDVGLVDIVDIKYRAVNELKALSKVEKEVWFEEDEVDQFFEKFVTTTSSQLATFFFNKMY